MNLFESNTLKGEVVRNSFMRSGTWIAKADDEGYVTEELLNYYKKLVDVNLGLVTVGYGRVNEFERANKNMIGLYDDKFIDGLKELSSLFKDSETKVGIQIAMGGTQVYRTPITWELLSPSACDVKHKDGLGNEMTYHVKEMTVEQIEATIADFASAARRVKQAGFDYVQIHAGHGYFISQWMNPDKNKRTDAYGLDKSKYVVDLYNAIRKEVGEDYTVAIKLNSEEKPGDFSNHSAMLEMCQKLDELGIDLIEVSGNMPSRMKFDVDGESYFKEFAKAVKASVKTKVALTGGNKTFDNMTKVQAETNVDYIGLSRTLVSEVDLVKTWAQDPSHTPRCVSCNHCHRKINVCIFDVEK